MLRRAVFALGLALSVGSMALSLAGEAQQAAKVYRIGVLSLTSFDNTTLAAVTIEGLGKLGYVVGRNIVVEDRFADGKVERLPALAAELVRLKVDVIVAGAQSAVSAARDATTTIPIVMSFVGEDPIKSGFVTNLARPGGNITGVTAVTRDLAPKKIDLLRDAVPGLTRLAVLTNPFRPEHAEYVRNPPGGAAAGVRAAGVGSEGPGSVRCGVCSNDQTAR